MSNRFHTAALFLKAPPVNPSGVAHTLYEAMVEAKLENPDSLTPVNDPACRVIFRDLATLMGYYLAHDVNERLNDNEVCTRINELRLTPQQFETLRDKWSDMGADKPETFVAFLLTAKREIGGPAVIVPWCGIWLGVEPDGYAHS